MTASTLRSTRRKAIVAGCLSLPSAVTVFVLELVYLDGVSPGGPRTTNELTIARNVDSLALVFGLLASSLAVASAVLTPWRGRTAWGRRLLAVSSAWMAVSAIESYLRRCVLPH